MANIHSPNCWRVLLVGMPRSRGAVADRAQLVRKESRCLGVLRPEWEGEAT
jgi:hypothetical protein